jgi:hypothetical protein
MPSNIAHMLIAYKALQRIQNSGVKAYADFASQLAGQFRPYVNLGSMGPDLFYYADKVSSIIDMIKDGTVKSKGVEPWSYHLHSVRPNEFPLKLIGIVFKDADLNSGGLTDQDNARVAFIAGHLTHIAADQIIHPLVNEVVGPYYISGANRENHRTCEVYQDIFLYNDVYRYEKKSGKAYDFFKQEFNKWADIKTDSWFDNTEDWFRYFIQRGFAETYHTFMDENVIEDSVDNLLAVLRGMTHAGPYKNARKEYNALVNSGKKSQNYTNFFEEPQYLHAYRNAVELAALYILALYEAYYRLSNRQDFSEDQKKRFCSIVSDADLSCPLQTDILAKAIKAFSQKTGEKQVPTKSLRAAVNSFTAVSPKQINAITDLTKVVEL